MIAMFDIPFWVIKQSYEKIKKKEGICKILPDIRIMIGENGSITPEHLVCSSSSGMGGQATGTAANYCENCIAKKNLKEFYKKRRNK